VARDQRQSARRVPGAKKALAGVAAGTGIAGSTAGLPERRFSPFVQPRGKPFLAERVATQEGITAMNRLELLVQPFQFSGQIWSTKRSTITAE
jgi:hypothetical protein